MSSTDTGKASEWQTEEIQKEIHNTDYSDIFNLVNPDDFVFLDPPYDCIFFRLRKYTISRWV